MKYIIIMIPMLLSLFGVAVYKTYSPKDNITESTIAKKSAEEEIRILMTYEGGESIAVLEDNSTTQSLLIQLPITVTIEDFAGAEKIVYFPENLSTVDAPEGYDPQLGDVACYGPWGNLVFYYKEQPYANGLVYMGKLESGLDTLGNLGEGIAVTMEQIP